MTKELFLPLSYPKHKKNSLTYDVVSAVRTGVMLEEPGVDTFLMKPVSTGNNPQLLEGKTQDLVVSYGHWQKYNTAGTNLAVYKTSYCSFLCFPSNALFFLFIFYLHQKPDTNHPVSHDIILRSENYNRLQLGVGGSV